MTARKLSDAEKQDILHLYRTTTETSSSLATRFGVSTSTVSRLLKTSLPADEYEVLIQQKRSLRSSDTTASAESPSVATQVASAEPDLAIAPPVVESVEVTAPEPSEAQPPERIRPILRRSRQTQAAEPPLATQLEVPLDSANAPEDSSAPATKPTRSAETTLAEAEVLKEILGQNVIEPAEEEELSSDLDDDLDDLEDDEEDFDDGEEGDDDTPIFGRGLKKGFMVQILPLADAPLPRTCYLVVDRSAELVAPPLKEFGDLGQIPDEEVQAKTLPIFDNHRIAKRYSNPRTQRVIKLPDGRMLSKTSSHLRAKGITRLLIDGQVYSLV